MSEKIAAAEESRMSRLLRALRQDISFYLKTLKLRFAHRLVFSAARLQARDITGNDIALFQQRFNHFAERYGIKVVVTGSYDADTIDAVSEFQGRAMYVLDADGFIGPETARVLHIKLLEG